MHRESTKRAVLEMARRGISYYQIERETGINHSTVGKWARAAGIKRGKGGGAVAKANEARLRESLERARSALEGKFEVLEWKPANHAVLKCCECGHVFSRKIDLRYKTTCPACHLLSIESNRKIALEKKEESSKRRILLKAFRKLLECKTREAELDAWLDEKHVCKECGASFTMRELLGENPWNFSSNPTFCSKECRKKWNKRNSGYRRRELESKGEGVSLNELIARDGNTCYICGGKCDKDDYRWSGGTFIAGPFYPSVDHVIPLSKGGANDASNAKLAHFLCNAIKSNGSVDEARKKIAKRGMAR